MVASIKIVTEYPLWFSIFCLLLGGIYAYVLYSKEHRFAESNKWLLPSLSLMRFLLVTILAFLLLSPFIKTLFNKVEKPLIVIAQDNSSSILLNKDSSFYQTGYLKALNQVKAELEDEYEVRTFTFGDQLEEGLKVDFSQELTDISLAMEEINTKFYNRNVGALILASDGIFNRGANPVYSTAIEFPIYTIAMGDTAIQRDVVLSEVSHNRLTFLGNQFPLEIIADAYQCEGEQTLLRILHQGKEVYTKKFELNEKVVHFTDNVLLEATKVGVQYYRIELATIKDELSVVNNVKDIYIEVLDGRQNILLLAEAPHPDLKALKLSIEKNENYEATSMLVTDFDGNSEPYSLVVAYQPGKVSSVTIQNLLKQNVSMLLFLGNNTDVSEFNRLNTGLKITQSRSKSNNMLPAVNKNFPLFTLSEKTASVIEDMPPLLGPFGNYNVASNGYSLLHQRIGNVTTEAPLMIFFQQDEKKVGVITGEGIWRWRLQDYLKNQNQTSFDELTNKIVQFLAVKEDKSKFRVFTENNYYENEEIQFQAELYNQSYELVNDPEIELFIKDEKDNDYRYSFNKSMKSYVLNAGRLPAGLYNYSASVKWGEKNYSTSGKFTINELQLEANRTVANHQLMQNMAKKFGGQLFAPTQLAQLAKAINSNDNIASVIYEEKELREIIHLKWIFFVLLALLSLEWFLRKRNGAY